MTRILSIGVGSIAALAMTAIAGVQLLGATSGTRHTEWHKSYANITRLDVDNSSGTVQLVGTDAAKLSVDRITREKLAARHPTATVRGGTLSLASSCSAWVLAGCDISYVIHVPHDVTVDARQGTGSLSASDLHGPTTLRTGAGGIDVSNVTGPLSARVSSGHIDVSNVSGGSVRLHTGSGGISGAGLGTRDIEARTGSGSITLGLSVVPTSVDARTGSGSAHVLVPRGPTAYDVHLDTGSGSRAITVSHLDSDSRHRIDVTTGSGSASVDYQN